MTNFFKRFKVKKRTKFKISHGRIVPFKVYIFYNKKVNKFLIFEYD